MTLKIIIDSREHTQNPPFAEELTKLGVIVLVDKLEFGDFFVPPLLVERKTVGNFLQSISSGQLWEQADGLKRTEGVIPAILLEGSLGYTQIRGFRISSVQGIMNSLIFDWKIPILYSPNKSWTTNLLFQLAKDFQLERKVKIHPIRTVRKDLSLPEIQRSVCESLPLIGPSHAIAMLKHAKTLRRLGTMGIDELKRIKGVGDNRAKKIREVFNTPYLGE